MRNLLLAGIGVLATLPACMTSPTDDGRVESRSASLPFSGYHITKGAEVRIEAFDPATGGFRALDTTNAKDEADPTAARFFDQPLFAWKKEVVVPDALWEAGAVRGFRARVKATTALGAGRVNLLTVERDYGRCLGANKTIGKFAQNCASDHSPEAWIYTRDWCDTAPPVRFGEGQEQPRGEAVLATRCGTLEIEVPDVQENYADAEVRIDWRGRSQVFSGCSYPSARPGQLRCVQRRAFNGTGVFEWFPDYQEAKRAGDVTLYVRARTAPGSTCDVLSAWTPVPAVFGDRRRCYSRPDDDDDRDPPPNRDPMPPATSGPNLTAVIDDHDGRTAPYQICNVGNAPVPTNDFYISSYGDARVGGTVEMHMGAFLPSTGLPAGACVRMPDANVAGWGGAGGDAAPSSTVQICVDTRLQIIEPNEVDNCVVRAARRR